MTDEEARILLEEYRQKWRLEEQALVAELHAKAAAANWIEQIEEDMPPAAILTNSPERWGNPKFMSETWQWGRYTLLDTRLGGKWWVPNVDWKCQRYLCSWPFGKPVESRREFNVQELAQEINSIDSYHCVKSSILKLSLLLLSPTGTKLGFSYHQFDARWEWTVL